MPPVSIVSVWQPARIASGTAARSSTPIHSGLTMPGRTISLRTTRTPRRTSSGMIGRSRMLRRASCARRGARAVTPLMRRARRIWIRLPIMTTPIRMSPWTTVARLVLTLRKVMSVRINWRITTATIGPNTPPRPPARLTPPRTTAATLSSV